jgi:Mrp family chromosome partitioning ATPase
VGRAATDAHIYTVFDLSRSSRLPVLGRLTSPRKDGTDHAFDFNQPEVVPALPQNNRALPAVPQLLTLRRAVRQPVSQTRANQPALQPSALSQGKVSLSGGIDAGALPPSSAEGVASQSSPLPDEYVVLYEQDLLSSASASSASEGRAQSSESQPPSSKSGGIHLAGLGYRIRLCELPKNPPPELTLLAAPQGARAEQLRLLRCRLEEQQDPRVLLFTSAKPGEGKTLCAANLALAYAEGGGAKVVLVDAHLSSGKLSKLLGAVAPSPGAGESAKTKGRDSKRSPTAQAAEPTHLAGGCPEVLQLQPNLFLVPASSLGAAARRAEILRSPAFAKLLSDLRESFDYVLIDTPAISEAADAKLVLRYADAGLLLVRAGKSTSSVIAAALGRLGRQGLTGAVLNELT